MKNDLPVLLVEDEALILELMVEDLREAGFAPIPSMTGAEALSALHAGIPFVALVTDIRLPGIINGWDVGDEFRERHPTAPIVFVTAFADEVPRHVPRSAFMLKPFMPEAVVAKLTELLQAVEDGVI